MPSSSFSDHVSNVFSTAVDLNHLFHPYKEVDPDDAPPTLANRIGAVCLLVLSLATLGILTGFYFYRADKKVVHLEKAEGRDEIISHLYRQRGPEGVPSKAQSETLIADHPMDYLKNRSLFLQGVAASREKSFSALNPHQKAVVKTAVSISRGNAKKALEQVKNDPLTLEEKNELLRVAIGGDQVSLVFDLLEAFSEEEVEEAVDVTPETKKAHTFAALLQQDLPWHEIKSEKMFEALWEKAKEHQDKLTPEAKTAIVSLVFRNEWVDKVHSIVGNLRDFGVNFGDLKSEKVFDAHVASRYGHLEKIPEGNLKFLFFVAVKNNWIGKLESIWGLLDHSLSKQDLDKFPFPWGLVKSREMFEALWVKRCSVKKDWAGDEMPILLEKVVIFQTVVRNDLVDKVDEVGNILGDGWLYKLEVQSKEMAQKLLSMFKPENEEKKAQISFLLHKAKSVEIAEALKNHGVEFTILEDVQSPLHTCIDPDVARYLIAPNGFEIPVNCRYDDTHPVALYTTPPAVQKILIEAGADVNLPHPNGYTLLHVTQDLEVAKLLLENGADVNGKDAEGRTPLHTCTDPEMMKLLIENGADIDVEDGDGLTPLSTLTNPKVLRMLAKVKDKDGNTLLHKCKEIDVAQRLMDHGADIEARNMDGMTPLLTCTPPRCNTLGISLEMISRLVEKGANVNAQDNQGKALLHTTSFGTILRYLLEHGAKANIRDKEGHTPLHRSCDLGAVGVLLDKGADPKLLDHAGQSPLFFVREEEEIGMTEVLVKELVAHGADPEILDHEGNKALIVVRHPEWFLKKEVK